VGGALQETKWFGNEIMRLGYSLVQTYHQEYHPLLATNLEARHCKPKTIAS